MDGWTVPGKFYIQRSPPPLSLSLSKTEQMTGETEFPAAGKPMLCNAMQCNARAICEGGK